MRTFPILALVATLAACNNDPDPERDAATDLPGEEMEDDVVLDSPADVTAERQNLLQLERPAIHTGDSANGLEHVRQSGVSQGGRGAINVLLGCIAGVLLPLFELSLNGREESPGGCCWTIGVRQSPVPQGVA